MNRNNIYKSEMLTTNELESFATLYARVIEDSGIAVDYYSYSSDSESFAGAVPVYMFISGENNVTVGKFDIDTVLLAIIPSEALHELDIIPSKNDKVVYATKPFYIRKISYLDKNQNILNDFSNSFLCECELVQKTNLLRSSKLM